MEQFVETDLEAILQVEELVVGMEEWTIILIQMR